MTTAIISSPAGCGLKKSSGWHNLGLTDELLRSPEIWYCISCRRCLEVCPNLVKPATTIAHVRYAMVANGMLPLTKMVAYRELFSYFQRVRWLTTAKCMEGEFSPIPLKTFQQWLQSSIPTANDVIFMNELPNKSVDFKKRTRGFNAAHCFNCGECSSACPISSGRNVFDPRTIFRMANFGLAKELLRLPSLWLCIGCGRCSDVCSQYVDGRSLIEDLKKMAVSEGVVDSGFRFRLEKANKMIFTHFLSHPRSIQCYN